MLGVAKPALATSALTIVRRLSQVKSTVLRCAQRSAMSDSLASKSLLDAQSFGGDQLNRSVGDRRDENFVQTAFQGSTSLLISGRSVLAKRRPGVSNDSPQSTELCWLSPEDLHDFGIEAQTDSQTTVAGLLLQNLRSMVAYLDASELAVAGHAVALANWHQANGFCGRCGAPTVPIEAGAKRKCTKDKSHRLYPRTDPVAIMLVESADGQQVLLGRAKTIPHNTMLTCLSGFVEQVETIEEACRREVMEEAGIEVGPVHIAGSQPWPMGRGGTCELMIGCIAKATSNTLHVDETEMDDVRWVSRDQLRKAVQDSTRMDTPYHGRDAQPSEGVDFWIPPPTAIAHHLIKSWADREASWFSKL